MRADLLALSNDSLAALASRGLVKRALREVADGRGPVLTEEDGTVTATFAEGTAVVLPAAATIEQSRCTCLAPGVCRHRVMLAVAYRGREPAPAPIELGWTPGEFTDDHLEAYFGSRTLATARKASRPGYRARVRRATAADPVPTVELASCTVRFLVPHQLGYARVDAARNARDDAVALAVWAFRLADEKDADAPILDVEAGGTAALVVAGGTGVEPSIPLLDEVLADGIAGLGPEVATVLAQVRRALDGRNLRWPVDLLDELGEQLDAYRARSARYQRTRAAACTAELVARHRCAGGGGVSRRVEVLGTEVAAETPLRLLRLAGLGARVRGDETSRDVEVYLAHPEAGVVLAVRRRIEIRDGELPTAGQLGRQTAGGVQLAALASGNVVTESAVRAANRVVRIADSRASRTMVAASSGHWDDLPGNVLIADLDAEATRLAALPPEVVRPRVVAESVRAVAVNQVEGLHYRPGAQELRATVYAPYGQARLVLNHSSAAPGAIDAMATALSGEKGPLRYVAGHLRRRGRGLEIEPTAVVVGTTVVVPAFAEGTAEAISTTSAGSCDPLSLAVDEALDVSADLVHHGQRRLPASWPPRAQLAAAHLRRVGLTSAASAVTSLAERARYGGPGLLDCWADTHLRLLVTAEQL